MERLRYTKVSAKVYAATIEAGKTLRLDTTLEPVLLEYVKLRASLVNHCRFCTAMHTAELRQHHEPETRIAATKDWEDSDAFTPRERAALAWTDRLTLLRGEEPTDTEYAAAAAFFPDKELVDLTWAIAQINAWNRMGMAFAPEWHEGRHAGSAHPSPTEATAPSSKGIATAADGD